MKGQSTAAREANKGVMRAHTLEGNCWKENERKEKKPTGESKKHTIARTMCAGNLGRFNPSVA
jgi:hypothetical protein